MIRISNLTLLVSSPDIKRQIFILQFLLLFSCFFEVGGISLLGSLIYLVSDPSSALENNLFAYLYKLSALDDQSLFILLFASLTISLIIIGGIASFLSVTYLSKIATNAGIHLSNQVFDRYLFLSWSDYLSADKSKMVNEIYQETVRVTQNIFLPLLMINKSLFLCFILICFLLTINWKVSLSLFFGIAAIYFILFAFMKSSLNTNSKNLTDAHQNRYKYLNDTFESMKQIHIWKNQKLFQDGFQAASLTWGNALRSNMNISLLPRYVVETMILVLVALGILILMLGSDPSNMLANLPGYSVFLFSAFKLLPAIQQVYTFSSTITGNLHSFDTLAKLLENKTYRTAHDPLHSPPNIEKITLKDISYSYPDSQFSLADINLEFNRGEVIGITGYSGSGKSTFVDLLMGLLNPKSGTVKLNEDIVKLYENPAWHNNLSYLPPSIHLFNDSVENNIHFSEDPHIDQKKLLDSLRATNLNAVENISQNSEIKNLSLSSGQIQRIGIARTMYRDRTVVIYDEPTSALDNNNKEFFIDIMNSVKSKKITFFITHDLELLKNADKVVIFNEGRVEYFGGYADSLRQSESMKKLTQANQK